MFFIQETQLGGSAALDQMSNSFYLLPFSHHLFFTCTRYNEYVFFVFKQFFLPALSPSEADPTCSTLTLLNVPHLLTLWQRPLMGFSVQPHR